MTDPHPLCYCFGHSIEDVEAEVASGEVDHIHQDIVERCRRGEARCAELNPSGRCCLANVRQAYADVRQAPLPARDQGSAGGAAEDCCAPGVEGKGTSSSVGGGRRRETSRWAPVAALAAAAGSSACCWLPLLLIGLGVSAAGVGSFFEVLRPYLMGLTALLLIAGFYVLYLRSPVRESGGAGLVPVSPRLRSRRRMFWCAAALCIGFLLFPDYGMPLLVGESAPASSHVSDDAELRTYRVSGMTCEGCATGLAARLSDLPSVQASEVDYASELARLWMLRSSADASIESEVARAGFAAERVP